MRRIMQWVLAAILISGASVFTSCTSDNDDNPSPKSGANSELVGQWYSDVSGATYAAWTYGKAWQQTELKADGTGVTNIYYLDGDVAVAREHYSFTYSATDGLLTMDIAERNAKTTARYTVSEGKLTLTEGDHQLAMQKMDDAKAKDFDAWSRKDNLVNVPQPARYTVFVYGNAGGTMDKIIEYGFWEKIQPLLTDHNNVRVVCFYKYGKDLPPKMPFTGKYADPGDIVWFDLNDTTKLENIRNGGLKAYGYEKEAQELKLCDPKTVSAFIQISSLVCPAEQYVFSIWGHGNGLNPLADVPGKYEDPAAAPATRGVIADEWNEHEELDMYELSTAIRSAGLSRLNTIFFHNCLMGNMETLTELRGLSDYIVASAHLLESEGELLTEYVRGLLEKGNTEDAIAQMFERVHPKWEQSYHGFEDDGKTEYWNNGDYKLIRTAKLDAIISATKRLADRLLALYPTQKDAIDKATTGVYRFFLRYNAPVLTFVNPFVDLADYAHLLAKETGDAEMAAISSDLDKAFSEAFVHYADVSTNEQHLDHYTLSVCLVNEENYEGNNKDPELIKAFVPNALCKFDQGYEQTTFHKLTGWGNWLRTNQQLLWDNPTSNGGGPLK
ncbi:clostripain-related cysteine peptidase [Prevotella sp. E13-27]|uniref:clostripain-related cysteine peptidase n=1 Tax=Prevotella sp. E13-27 TaxID=2938122 RepID=UPI00200AF239|nr:clostripain-related cysteine peptidase [Prevotella sp. E13-27]MCK8622198.1 clostripain-related cysteine peptidase [Prevotella sp. E13-27]